MNFNRIKTEGETINFYIAKCDYYGNPRRIVHYFDFFADHETNRDYDEAKKRAKKAGFSVYRGRDFGGGFVAQCYNEEQLAKRILEQRPPAPALTEA